ncbi:MAG: hypothetical protein M3014_02255 [Chloroflexota bacterium]|nr:hypothetical protein [Chloroflexota bacterium]
MGKFKAVTAACCFTLIPVLIVALATGLQKSSAQENKLVWAPITSGIVDRVDFSGVYMVNSNDAWISGIGIGGGPTQGALYQVGFNGSRWQTVSRQVFNRPILALSVVTDTNVWAVGRGGLIAHKDGTTWREVPNPLSGITNAELTSIQMLGNGEEGWAGGSSGDYQAAQRGVVLHYNGGQWKQDALLGGSGSVVGLHFAQGAGWAITPSGIFHYDGAWHQEEIPICQTVGAGRGSASGTATVPTTPVGTATSVGAGTPCQYIFMSVRAINRDEAWVAGVAVEQRANPNGNIQSALLLHRVNGSWQQVIPGEGILGDPFAAVRAGGSFSGLSLTAGRPGFAVGAQFLPNSQYPPNSSTGGPYIVSYEADDRWHYQQTPRDEQGRGLSKVSQADSDHALAVGSGVILSYGYGVTEPPQPTPTSNIPPPVPTVVPTQTLATGRVPDYHYGDGIYFPLVGHNMRGGFRDYWLAHGGLEQFGYPLTEEYMEVSPTDRKLYIVQYFERARFEFHPENHDPYRILLGLLGYTVTPGRNGEMAFQPHGSNSDAGNVYFPETRHNMPKELAVYWQTHGGLPVYGYPISEPFIEASKSDGKTYLVQYFERNRLEYHPELPEVYRVSLGLLGSEVLRARGWLP